MANNNFAVSANDEVISKGKLLREKMAKPGERQGEVLGRIFDLVAKNLDGETLTQGGVDVQALDSSLSNIRTMFLSAITGKEQIVAAKGLTTLIETVPADDAIGKVASQDPAPGTTIDQGSKVNIVLSLGPETTEAPPETTPEPSPE